MLNWEAPARLNTSEKNDATPAPVETTKDHIGVGLMVQQHAKHFSILGQHGLGEIGRWMAVGSGKITIYHRKITSYNRENHHL